MCTLKLIFFCCCCCLTSTLSAVRFLFSHLKAKCYDSNFVLAVSPHLFTSCASQDQQQQITRGGEMLPGAHGTERNTLPFALHNLILAIERCIAVVVFFLFLTSVCESRPFELKTQQTEQSLMGTFLFPWLRCKLRCYICLQVLVHQVQLATRCCVSTHFLFSTSLLPLVWFWGWL